MRLPVFTAYVSGFLFSLCNKTYLRTHLIFRGPLGCYDHYGPRSCGPTGSIPSQGRSCWSSSRAHRSWRFWAHLRGIWSDWKCPNTWRGMGKAMNMVGAWLGWKASTELMSYFCSQPSWFGVCCLSNFAVLSDDGKSRKLIEYELWQDALISLSLFNA